MNFLSKKFWLWPAAGLIFLGFAAASTPKSPTPSVQGAATNDSPSPSVEIEGSEASSAPIDSPAPVISPKPSPTKIPAPTSALSNTNTYTNSAGNTVHSPAYTQDDSVPSGASAQCGDGTYSFSQSRRGTCSHHGGVTRWL